MNCVESIPCITELSTLSQNWKVTAVGDPPNRCTCACSPIHRMSGSAGGKVPASLLGKTTLKRYNKELKDFYTNSGNYAKIMTLTCHMMGMNANSAWVAALRAYHGSEPYQ